MDIKRISVASAALVLAWTPGGGAALSWQDAAEEIAADPCAPFAELFAAGEADVAPDQDVSPTEVDAAEAETGEAPTDPAAETVPTVTSRAVGEDEPAAASTAVTPDYPPLAAQCGVEGAVTARFAIDADGVPTEIEILSAQPEGVFEEVVLAALPDWRFPADAPSGERAQEFSFTLEPASESVPAEETGATEEPAARDWGRAQPVADLVESGGPIILILIGLSVVSLAIICVKLLQFQSARVGDAGFIEKAARKIQAGDADGALSMVAGRRGVIARVMEAALRGRVLGLDEGQVREEVERVARVKLDGLERGLPLLSVIATSSPLLGLLGTVLGMIEAFQQLQSAGDRVDPAILSGGIWEALLTTAAGLSVAIPSAAFFAWLQRAVDVAGQHMENAATRVFTADLYTDDSDDA
ncbi:MAG: TonB family protein [Pseudomonadota bacterium]